MNSGLLMGCVHTVSVESAGDPKIEIQNSATTTAQIPVVWTIAGSDSGGGAGIQADLKVMNAFGLHGCSVITALTAQNTDSVKSVESVSPAMFRAQLDALKSDLPPVAVKTGMLSSLSNCTILADFLSSLHSPQPALICDPILHSTSGKDLIEKEALDVLLQRIFPYTSVLTPNLPEAETLLGKRIESVESAAAEFLAMGARSVLIKGGHTDADTCSDYWTDGTQSFWLHSPRIDTNATHGTGCILSSAITSALALGQSEPEALITAKTYLNQCLRLPANLGSGHGPMQIRPFMNAPEDRPEIQ